MRDLKTFYRRYRHGIPAVAYLILYLAWFCLLEKHVTKHYEVIHMKIDNFIPFCEVFIVPYLLWFLYVAVVWIYLFLNDKDKSDFIKYCIFLYTGMTIFLMVSTLWPNGHHLRPHAMPRDNIFTDMILKLYAADTSTNIWPSIHVYNSIGAHLAVAHCEKLKKYKLLRFSSLILCISIICSTVLIKQHSMFDVFTAFILGACMYVVVYPKEYSLVAYVLNHRRRKRHPQVKKA